MFKWKQIFSAGQLTEAPPLRAQSQNQARIVAQCPHPPTLVRAAAFQTHVNLFWLTFSLCRRR